VLILIVTNRNMRGSVFVIDTDVVMNHEWNGLGEWTCVCVPIIRTCTEVCQKPLKQDMKTIPI